MRAVIAESFERIHRSNLIGMGVLPLEFTNGDNRKKLQLEGNEKITILEMNNITPNKLMHCTIKGESLLNLIDLKCRIDTMKELDYYKAGGTLQYVLNLIVDTAS